MSIPPVITVGFRWPIFVFFHGLLYFNSEVLSTNNDPQAQRLGLTANVKVVKMANWYLTT